MKKYKWVLIFLLLATMTFAFLGQIQFNSDYQNFMPPKDEYWNKFSPVGDLHKVTWLSTSSFDEWSYKTQEGETLRIGRHLLAVEDLSWLKGNWESRTKNLQKYPVDPYFPDLIKGGECHSKFKPTLLASSDETSTFFSLGAGENFKPGSCDLKEVKYRMLRRIYHCGLSGDREVLYVADLFINLKDDFSKDLSALSRLPCLTHSP